jgi:hypothetical protein
MKYVLPRLFATFVGFTALTLASAYSGRFLVFLLGLIVTSLLFALRRLKPLWVPWIWTAAIPLLVLATQSSVDVRFGTPGLQGAAPAGIWVRPVVYGYDPEGPDRDVRGVPEYWSMGCMTPMYPPRAIAAISFGFPSRIARQRARARARREQSDEEHQRRLQLGILGLGLGLGLLFKSLAWYGVHLERSALSLPDPWGISFGTRMFTWIVGLPLGFWLARAWLM